MNFVPTIIELSSVIEVNFSCDKTLVLEAIIKTGSSSAITSFATAHYILATNTNISLSETDIVTNRFIESVDASLRELAIEGILSRQQATDGEIYYYIEAKLASVA